jgi:hypothetical protein
MNTLRFGAILTLFGALALGCSSDDKNHKDESTSSGGGGGGGESASSEGGDAGATSHAEPLEIIGKYSDNFGSEQIITATNWNDAAIVDYDNDKNVVYTQFPDDAMYNPSKFAKTVYTQPDKSGSFYFCMVEFSLDTLEEARASTATADDSDPENSGCGMFSWTKASPE